MTSCKSRKGPCSRMHTLTRHNIIYHVWWKPCGVCFFSLSPAVHVQTVVAIRNLLFLFSAHTPRSKTNYPQVLTLFPCFIVQPNCSLTFSELYKTEKGWSQGWNMECDQALSKSPVADSLELIWSLGSFLAVSLQLNPFSCQRRQR